MRLSSIEAYRHIYLRDNQSTPGVEYPGHFLSLLHPCEAILIFILCIGSLGAYITSSQSLFFRQANRIDELYVPHFIVIN